MSSVYPSNTSASPYSMSATPMHSSASSVSFGYSTPSSGCSAAASTHNPSSAPFTPAYAPTPTHSSMYPGAQQNIQFAKESPAGPRAISFADSRRSSLQSLATVPPYRGAGAAATPVRAPTIAAPQQTQYQQFSTPSQTNQQQPPPWSSASSATSSRPLYASPQTPSPVSAHLSQPAMGRPPPPCGVGSSSFRPAPVTSTPTSTTQCRPNTTMSNIPHSSVPADRFSANIAQSSTNISPSSFLARPQPVPSTQRSPPDSALPLSQQSQFPSNGGFTQYPKPLSPYGGSSNRTQHAQVDNLATSQAYRSETTLPKNMPAWDDLDDISALDLLPLPDDPRTLPRSPNHLSPQRIQATPPTQLSPQRNQAPPSQAQQQSVSPQALRPPTSISHSSQPASFSPQRVQGLQMPNSQMAQSSQAPLASQASLAPYRSTNPSFQPNQDTANQQNPVPPMGTSTWATPQQAVNSISKQLTPPDGSRSLPPSFNQPLTKPPTFSQNQSATTPSQSIDFPSRWTGKREPETTLAQPPRAWESTTGHVKTEGVSPAKLNSSSSQMSPVGGKHDAILIDADEGVTCGELKNDVASFSDDFPDPPFQFDDALLTQPTRSMQYQNDLKKLSSSSSSSSSSSQHPIQQPSPAWPSSSCSPSTSNTRIPPTPTAITPQAQVAPRTPSYSFTPSSQMHQPQHRPEAPPPVPRAPQASPPVGQPKAQPPSFRTASGYEFAQQIPTHTSPGTATNYQPFRPTVPPRAAPPAVAARPAARGNATKEPKPRAPRKRKDAQASDGSVAPPKKPRGKRGAKQAAAEEPPQDSSEAFDIPLSPEDSHKIGGGGVGSTDAGMGSFSVLEWLKPERLRDIKGRPLGHPEYDSKTLYVPPEAWAVMAPAQEQYWRIKQTNFDLVLLFKIGKFYELFEMDAHIGVRELGLSYMTGSKHSRPHSGFPEPAYDKYAQQFIQLGYRVGRVEQMENPKMLAARNSSENKKDKAVKRELVSITSRGTMTEPGILPNEEACYLMALWETKSTPAAYGVCFVDTATGQFNLGQFLDDSMKTHLQTLLAQIRPEEVVYCKSNLSPHTLDLVKEGASPKALLTDMSIECWSPERTLMEMKNQAYFTMTSTDLGPRDSRTGFPLIIAEMARKQEVVALAALGGCVAYLKRLMLDVEILSQARFRTYDPRSEAEFLVIDGASLKNLDILVNEEGAISGTLLAHLDHTSTPFGKRMLRRWVTRPLGQVSVIEDRLDAVEDLVMFFRIEQVRGELKKLPDLERDLSRIHAYGVGKDSSAIMYCNAGPKRIDLFLGLIQGFRRTKTIVEMVKGNPLKSQRLTQIVTPASQGGVFPDLEEALHFFETAFDHPLARKVGYIKPYRGVDPEFDEAEQQVIEIEQHLENHLQQQRLFFQDSSIQYAHRGNERYQLEIPIATLARVPLPREFEAMSATTKVKRFWTPQIKTLIPALDSAQEQKDAMTKELTRLMFSKFCSVFQQWATAAACVAELDCLMSLALCSKRQSYSTRPIFETATAQPLVEIRQGVHVGVLSREFVPNDIVLGAAENPERFMLVTGPNMGGKSTLLRQTCIIVIMAHLGCLVPAQYCRLSPVDRIFTRVGANDRIMHGRSTFLVELEETSVILRHATPRSLVILDELGRGTSTFDGSAIAFAVVEHLLKIGCLALFSTHYHTLVQEFVSEPAIGMFHMAYKLASGDDTAQERGGFQHQQQQQTGPTLTFLYKFTRGACPQSFGMNVASIAGLAPSVVNLAITKARELEQAFQKQKNNVAMLRHIWGAMRNSDLQTVRALQQHMLQR